MSASQGRIGRMIPAVEPEASDEQLLAWYEEEAAHENGRPWLRLNFVSSADGSATHDGLSGGLGDAADRRVFGLLRRLGDVVLVGAGTVRAEGYGAMRLDAASAAWRAANGRAPQPVLAVVSARLELDPESELFTAAPVRPLVFTVQDAPASRIAALAGLADVVIVGERRVTPQLMLDELARRGLLRVHSEGGPTLAGTLLAAGAVDELCLTLAARLEGGSGPRITGGVPAPPQSMRLAQLLRSDSTLLLRYVR